MTSFIAEIRSPSITWESHEHPDKSELQQMKTTYVTVPVLVEAPDYESAVEAANELYPNMVRTVHCEEKS